MLKGQKMTNSTQYIESPEGGNDNDNNPDAHSNIRVDPGVHPGEILPG